MTTYALENSQEYSRYFHDIDSISCFLTQAGFHIIHTKIYDEQLCVDFERTKLAKQIDILIEVFASK